MKKAAIALVLASMVLGGAFGLTLDAPPAAEGSNSSFGLGLSLHAFGLTNDSDLTFLSDATRGRTPNENGLHWTTVEKILLGVYNWAFGVGSFMMGDTVGGLIFGGLGILARAMFVANDFEFQPNAFGIVGIAAEVLILSLSHVRVFAYDRRVSREAGTFHSSANPINGITVVPVAMESGDLGMGFFYRRSLGSR